MITILAIIFVIATLLCVLVDYDKFIGSFISSVSSGIALLAIMICYIHAWKKADYLKRKYNVEYNPKDDGILEVGRGLDFDKYVDADERGAHVLNYNGRSIGICLIGTDKFTKKQIDLLISFCRIFKGIHQNIQIKGHYEMPTARGKTCPNIDMDILRECVENPESYEKIEKYIG